MKIFMSISALICAIISIVLVCTSFFLNLKTDRIKFLNRLIAAVCFMLVSTLLCLFS